MITKYTIKLRQKGEGEVGGEEEGPFTNPLNYVSIGWNDRPRERERKTKRGENKFREAD